MRSSIGPLLVLLAVSGCAGLGSSPEEQRAQQVDAVRMWLRGPMTDSCTSLPGSESRTGCLMALERSLAGLRYDSLTRDDHYRIELAKAKGADETTRLWTRTEREAWLRGPRTVACRQAPLSSYVQRCREGVQQDLDLLSHPDGMAVDSPEVRAARAVERIVAREQEQAIERQRTHERALVQDHATGQALMGLMMGGGLFRNPPAPTPPAYQPQSPPVLPLAAPTRTLPPVSCTSQQAGRTVYTDCY